MYSALMKWSDAVSHSSLMSFGQVKAANFAPRQHTHCLSLQGRFQGVPEPQSLKERLLCVKIQKTSLYRIRLLMEMVASVATFVSFLPLANRVLEHTQKWVCACKEQFRPVNGNCSKEVGSITVHIIRCTVCQCILHFWGVPVCPCPSTSDMH